MGVYELGPNEAVIMSEPHAFEGRTGITLILTNENIIQVNKGFLGGEKSAAKYPLLELKEYEGKPNVIVGKNPNGGSRLELYFSSCEKYYTFQSRLAEHKWANAIEKAYKVCASEKRKSEKAKIGFGAVVAPLKGTLESARQAVMSNSRGTKSKTVKCPRCGAELTGEKGQQVKCSYCEALVQIK